MVVICAGQDLALKEGNPLKTEQSNKKAAVIISLILSLLVLFSLVYLLLPGPGSSEAGRYSIPLNNISENRSIIIESPDGGKNEIELRPGSIGIVSADCPDKLCVRQGFISDARLPITCLPNRLVILLRPALNGAESDSITPDIVTY